MIGLILLLLTVVVWVVWISARRPFLDAMTAANLVRLRAVACELERRALAGELDPEGDFFKYHHSMAMALAQLKPREVPGLTQLFTSMVQREAPDRGELSAALEDPARKVHKDLLLEFYAALLGVYRYRNVVVWALMKAGWGTLYFIVGLVYLNLQVRRIIQTDEDPAPAAAGC